MKIDIIFKAEKIDEMTYFTENLLKNKNDVIRFAYKDTWGKRRGAFLPSRSFNQLWKERQQK